MNKQEVTRVYIWQKPHVAGLGEPIHVTIIRHGVYGHSEHVYDNISQSSFCRILKATPSKPTEIGNRVLVYNIR